VICFLSNWQQLQFGVCRGGTILEIEYARERIQGWPDYGGVYTPRDWWHYAHLRFHPGDMYQKVPLFYADPPERPCNPILVTVPAGATQLEVWFEHVLYHFEPRQPPYVFWDSQYGNNYWFTVIN
jgi:hypothetical protein